MFDLIYCSIAPLLFYYLALSREQSLVLKVNPNVTLEGGRVEAQCDYLGNRGHVVNWYWRRADNINFIENKQISDEESFIISSEERRWKGTNDEEIATSNILNDKYIKTGRYFANFTAEKNDTNTRLKYNLIISNISREESGLLGCRIQNLLDISSPLQVFVPPNSIHLLSKNHTYASIHSNGDVLELNENEKIFFSCKTNGSYPAPLIKIILKKHISSSFNLTDLHSEEKKEKYFDEKNKNENEEAKSEKIEDEVDLTNHFTIRHEKTIGDSSFSSISEGILKVDYRFKDRYLTCSVSHKFSLQPPLSAAVLIHIQKYRPKFFCSPSVISAHPYQSNFIFNCSILSKPPLTKIQISWKQNSLNSSPFFLPANQKMGIYQLIQKNEPPFNVIFKIDKLFPQTFRKYKLQAWNEDGSNSKTLEVKKFENPFKDLWMSETSSSPPLFPLSNFFVFFIFSVYKIYF